jgi:hypothetical protein
MTADYFFWADALSKFHTSPELIELNHQRIAQARIAEPQPATEREPAA